MRTFRIPETTGGIPRSALLEGAESVSGCDALGRPAVWQAGISEEDAREIGRISRKPPRGMRIFKFGSRSVVGSFHLSSGREVCLKYYLPSRFYKHLNYGLGRSRCRQSRNAGTAFQEAGIPTPAPLAVVQWRRFWGVWFDSGLIVTEKAEGVSLPVFVESNRNDLVRLEGVAEKLRCSFSKMARYRIAHGDLKGSNILVDESGEITFVDLDAAVICASPKQWEKRRKRDEALFAKNWKKDAVGARIFGGLFEAEDRKLAKSAFAAGKRSIA